MEPSAKRARIGAAPYDVDDELCLEPEEVNAQRDPAVLLEKQRAVAVYKLKSRWESVFAKYGNIAEDEGDEIDFETGEIVRNNGHIQSMENKRNDNDVEAEEEEDRILHGKATGGQLSRLIIPGSAMRPSPFRGLGTSSSSMFGTPRLSTMFSQGPQFGTPMPYGAFTSFNNFVTPNRPVEPIWEVPEIPIEAYEYSARPLSRAVVPRKAVKWTPSAVRNDEGDDDDDDVLLGSTNYIGKERTKQRVVNSPATAVTMPARPLRKPPEPNANPPKTSEKEAAPGPVAVQSTMEQGVESLPAPLRTDVEEDRTMVPWVKKGRRIEVVLTRFTKKRRSTMPIPQAEITKDMSIPDRLTGISKNKDNISSSALVLEGVPPVVQLATTQEVISEEATPAALSDLTPKPTELQPIELQAPELQRSEQEPSEPPLVGVPTPDVVLPKSSLLRPTTPIQSMASKENDTYPEGETPASVRRRRRDRFNPTLLATESCELVYQSPKCTAQSDVRLKKQPRRSLPTPASDIQSEESLEKDRRHSLPPAQLSSPGSGHPHDTASVVQTVIPPEAPSLPSTEGGTCQRQEATRSNTQTPRVRPSPATEHFSRNIMDASYTFSDEDDSFVPRTRNAPAGRGKQAQLQMEAPAERSERPRKVSHSPKDATPRTKETRTHAKAHAEPGPEDILNPGSPRYQTPPTSSAPPPRDVTPSPEVSEVPKRSPPKGRAFRYDGKRPPAVALAESVNYRIRDIPQQSPTLSADSPASRVFDMWKQAQRQEREATPDQEEAVVSETAVSSPTVPHGKRVFAIRGKPSEPFTPGQILSSPHMLPLSEHQDNDNPQSEHERNATMSSKSASRLKDIVQDHGSALCQVSTIDTSMLVPSSLVSDSSPTKKRKRQVAVKDVEERRPSLSPDLDLLPVQDPTADETPVEEAPILLPAVTEVEPRRSKRRKASSAVKETSAPKSAEASTGQDATPSSPNRAEPADDQVPGFPGPDQAHNDETPATTPSVSGLAHSVTVKKPVVKTTKGTTASSSHAKAGHHMLDKQPKTPSQPKCKDFVSRLSSVRPSTSRLSVISLVSDDEDQDELSFSFERVDWSQARSDSAKEDKDKEHVTFKHVTRTTSKSIASSSRKSASTVNRTGVHKSHKERAKWRRSTGGVLSSPAVEMVRTSGGTVRKCGECGFKCDRDFCFVCL